jgi:hypothetical protein
VTTEEARRVLLVEAQIELYRGRVRWELWNAIAMLKAWRLLMMSRN